MSSLFGAFRVASVVSLISLGAVAGCGLLGKKGDGADAAAEASAVVEAAEAAPPPVAAPPAANENDVSRFPDEKKLDSVAATLQRAANVREIPGIGKVVAQLAKGSTVTELSQRDKYFLVVFDSPKDPKKLMGWLNQEAFAAQADAGALSVKCVAPDTALVSDAAFCGRICAADADCPAGQACRGAANRLSAAGVRGGAVTVCTALGAPRAAVVDASAPPPPPPPPVVVPTPAANVGVVAPTSGKCPTDFVLVKDGQCHRTCVRINGCPGSAPLCLNCAGPMVCASNRDICK